MWKSQKDVLPKERGVLYMFILTYVVLALAMFRFVVCLLNLKLPVYDALVVVAALGFLGIL